MPGRKGIKRVSLSPCRAQGDGERAVPHVPKTAVREGGGGGTSEGSQAGSPAPPRARARGSCAGGWRRRALSGSDARRRRWELDEEGDRASERTRALLRTLRTHPRGPAAAGGGQRRAERRRDACDRAGGRPRRACRERTCVGSPWVLGEPRAPAGKTPPGRRAAQCPSSAARRRKFCCSR